ncbi:MAG: nicotinamide-nucleotide amidohydrolase family protein [Clostridia bacterium]|nr:nicotinamide-nucleotide amidohydrolase family protein [Clostridia bacterium]
MIAEILCIGTELLMGQTLNTNAQFISRRLSALGISQYHQSVVGDNEERLEAAKVAGQALVLRPEAEAMVRERFRRLGRTMTENNLSQAMFTPDSTVLENPWGTAPGAIVPVGEGKAVIHLPGPPRELEPMFTEHVEPWLQTRSGRVLVSRYIRIFGMGEAEVDSRLSDLMEGSNPTLSPYCATGEVMLRATASAASEAEAQELLLPLMIEVRLRLGSVIYAVEEDDGGSLEKCAVAALGARGWTCATCESLTGGLIAATLVNVSGSSSVVRGGFVTYQTDTKTLLAGVPAEVIEEHNVVSAEVAMGMAQGTRERLGVDIAVSATGLAGPGGGTPERPVGTVFVGVSTAKGTYAIPLHLTGDRLRIRTLSVKHAINALRMEALKK